MRVPDHHMVGVSRACVPESTNLLQGPWREICGGELRMHYHMSRVCGRSVQNVTPSYPAEGKLGRKLEDNIKMGKEIRHDGLALDSSYFCTNL
jgi:hypothetical protein